MDLLGILTRRVRTPNLQDWITWGQSAHLAFPIGSTTRFVTNQLVRATRHPPTTWTFLTVFRFVTTPLDFAAAQNLGLQVIYRLGVGQVQVEVVRDVTFANFNTPPVTDDGRPFGNITLSAPPAAVYTIQEQFPAEDIQVLSNVAWQANAGSLGQAQVDITAFVAPVVY